MVCVKKICIMILHIGIVGIKCITRILGGMKDERSKHIKNNRGNVVRN